MDAERLLTVEQRKHFCSDYEKHSQPADRYAAAKTNSSPS